jgi:hypothetical protein
MEEQSVFEQEGVVPLGWDHASLALTPFLAAGRAGEDRRRPVTVTYQAEVDGGYRRISVTLRPGAELELPTQADQVVFLALLQEAVASGWRERTMVRRAALLRSLGWTVGGSTYERLRESLERLTAVTLSVQALRSREGRDYRTASAMHIIEAFHFSDGYDSAITVVWGELVRQAAEMGDLKRLDWDLVRALDNPLTVQLYRLLDRVTLCGERQWSVGWRSLSIALGMSTEAYARPARFRQVLEPHIASLVEQGVLEGCEYERGGKFTFHVTNYLRSQLRRVLTEKGVFPHVARQLVAAYDEVRVISQLDCLPFRKAQSPAALLVKSIQENYPLSYPADEPAAFEGLVGVFSREEVALARGLAERLSGQPGRGEPSAWPVAIRALTRFCLTQSIDPERV